MSTEEIEETEEMEDLEHFRQRAREFVGANLRRRDSTASVGMLRADRTDEQEFAAVAREREVQRMLFDAGLAGICFPREYGGQGLTPAHQQVLNEELHGHEWPLRLQSPSISQCGAVILDFGTEEQKRRHLPAILRGDEIWSQLLSEPSSGSDVAGALMTAVRDGDEWVVNGSKVWTSGAWWSDWGLCLVRTNWEVPKHRGLTVFMLPLDSPGIEVHRIEMLSGLKEFCQEFLTDVRVPDRDRVGDVDDGWTVGTGWMFHERMGYNSPYVTRPLGVGSEGSTNPALAIAHRTGRLHDPAARELVGESHMLALARRELLKRVADGIATGAMSSQAAAIGRLFTGAVTARTSTIAFELVGSAGAAWADDDGEIAGIGGDFLMRQASCIGGGTTEMARNVISERVLGMPRERVLDRDVPFRDVPRSRPSSG